MYWSNLKTGNILYLFMQNVVICTCILVKNTFEINRASTMYTIILLNFICRTSQTAGRNYCFIVSGDVSNCSYSTPCHDFASQFGLAIYLTQTKSPALVFILVNHQPAIDRQQNRRNGAFTPSLLGTTDPSNNKYLNGDGGACALCVCARARACVRVRAWARACVRACVHACVRVYACVGYTIIILGPG